MDWKIIEEIWIQDDSGIEHLQEFLRQHLQEHHGPHRHRFGDGVWVTGSALPMEDKPERPQFKLNLENADIGKPEVCECPVWWPDMKQRAHSWKFCPYCGCGLKLKGGG